MANVLTVVAKIRAAKGKGDALAKLLARAGRRRAQGGAGLPRLSPASLGPRTPTSSSSTSSTRTRPPSIWHRKAPHLASYRERREKEGLTEGAAEVEIYKSHHGLS